MMVMDLRFPIGPFIHEGEISEEQRQDWILDIAQLPQQLRTATHELNEEQLDTPYRPDGWTVRQVVHHLADSHLNSFARFKLALTEEQPTIKPYYEERWALLSDSTLAPIHLSLTLLEGLHGRWASLLQSLTEGDFARTFYHPGSEKVYRLDETLGTYSWHGRHHVAHITALRKRNNWY